MAQNNNKVDFHRLGSELWDIANIFRDDTLKTTEYLEEFSYFLFLKLFDEREKQREELARLDGTKFVPDLPNHLRFSTWAEKILASDGKTVKTDDGEFTIVDYVRNIFSELAEVKDHDGRDLSLFRRLFKNHIWRIRYSPTIKELIKRLKDLELEQNFDVMGRAYEFVVQKLGEQKQYGQYFTPRHIIHFMVELADPEIGEKIYDPAAGTGGFILRAFEVVKSKIDNLVKAGMRVNESTAAYNGVQFDEAEMLYRKLKEESLYAVEKAPDVYKLALMNMILHNDGKSNLFEADSLDNRAQLEHKEKYDVVLTNPPYGPLAQSRVGTFEFHAKRYEALFIQHIMAALRPSEPGKKRSRAVVIILDKILFDNSSVFKNIRMKLLREFDLKAVFSMPAGIFQPYSGVKTSVLYFEKPTKEEWNETKKQNAYTTKQVLFVDVKDDGFTLTTQRRPINGAFQGDDPNIYEPPCGNLPKAVEVFRKWIDWINNPTKELPDFIDNDFCWTATIEEIKAKDYNLNPGLYKNLICQSRKHNIVRLGEIIEQITDRNVLSEELPVYSVSKEFGIIPAENYFKENVYGNNEEVYAKNLNSYKIIYKDYFVYNPYRINIGSIGFADNVVKGLVSPAYVVFKVKDSKTTDSRFLYYLLKTDWMMNKINEAVSGSIRDTLKFDDLANIQIPLPPLPVQQELVARLDKQQAIIEQCNAMEKAILEAGIDDSIFEGDWEWVELESLCNDILSGGTPSTKVEAYWKGSIPWITSADIQGIYEINVRKFITEEAVENSTTKIIPANNIIVATRVGLGKLCLNKFDVCISQDCQGLIINENVMPEYMLFALYNRVQSFKQESQGSTVQGVTKDHLKAIKIPLPPIEKQQEIVDFLNVQFETLTNIRRLKENAKQTIKMILDREVFGE
ncbi:N-6 DNA methylase [Tepidanaerobacter sp. GT38]|uniref:N-6 DNA methylase n=1 Tax=Tepidanaerobacter sp. GT38 TaxID=2722793 RepID=UPI001EFF7C3A|nr:N-6 DNA methylase [Tepidanaerobacter sp. GT38]MCG1012589.1 N-6 DNA methylase [Tepidanaerobacter sp. GT38]